MTILEKYLEEHPLADAKTTIIILCPITAYGTKPSYCDFGLTPTKCRLCWNRECKE